jgi:hypothetical protein
MARTRKKTTEPAPVEREGEGVKVTIDAERTSPEAPPAPDGAKADQAPRRPRARKQPAPPQPAPVPALGNLLGEAESLRERLGDAGRQAEETRQLIQTVRHQHEELTREVESLRQQAGSAAEAAARQADEVRGQVESLKVCHEEADREIAGLRQHAGETRLELQETLKMAAAVRTELGATARRLEEAEGLFREAAQRLVADLKGEIVPAQQRLAEAIPHLQSFPAQSAQVLERLEQTARALPDALRQLQRLEQQGQEASRRLSSLREEVIREEQRLAALREEVRGAEGRLQEARQTPAPAAEAAAASAVEAVLEAPRPKLGLTVGPGVVIDEVVEGSPAHQVGLSPGDVIQAVNGVRVADGGEVRSLVQAVRPGENVALTVSRAGEAIDLSLTLVDPSAQPSEEGRPYLGLTVHPGVVVAEVHPGSPAEAAGLARGDVIQAANGTPVLAGEQIRQAVLWEQLRRAVRTELGAAAPETELSLEVSRGGQVREVKVPLPLGQPPA